AVPFRIVPEAPVPSLDVAALEISPADPAAVFDLQQLTSWEGPAQWQQTNYIYHYVGESFVIEQNGSELSYYALDTAVPGTEEHLTITLAEPYADTAPGRLSLKVG